MVNDFSPLVLIFLIVCLFFLIHYLVFLALILRGLKNLMPSSIDTLPHEFVSIIIPFRNEEENLIASLKSIESQTYPKDKFEVIYVNDSSEDNSIDLLSKNVKKNNIRILTVPKDYSIYAHKKRAIRYGIENAKGQIIITTDADCTHDEEWLISLISYFDSLTGFVSGPVEFHQGNNLFSKFQQLEFAGLVFCGAGLIGAGHPTICNAANIAYRKKVFDEVGGFKDQMHLSSGDDELLMQKIAKDSDYKVKFCLNKKAIVKTAANNTMGEFYQQRKRWASKGLFYSDKSLVLKLILIYLFYVGLIVQFIFSFFLHPVLLLSFIVSIILKLFFELRVLLKGKKIIFMDLRLNYFLLTELIQIPYIVFAGIVGAFGNYFWKERKIKR
jgi:cellulose synthase/poly-beta-1,6-N-acetylglucosamine synthase-like glycosyltransferase